MVLGHELHHATHVCCVVEAPRICVHHGNTPWHCPGLVTPFSCVATVARTPSPLQDSFEMGSNGAVTMLSKSITPYQFSSEGMIKAASRQQPQHHYRVGGAHGRARGTTGVRAPG